MPTAKSLSLAQDGYEDDDDDEDDDDFQADFFCKCSYTDHDC